MPKVIIDGKEVEVAHGMTVLQACEQAGAEIPRFCYHERLSIAGNCRMCLVEIEKSPKPVASCAMPVMDNMVVHTNTETVKKAREGVMEFLLINHPLDCPICDQGGECDLQDQAMAYGRGQNRFHENKRAVPEKYMGPLIKTHMTRCIHCTRCIRFITEVAGVQELGACGRGEHMEVTTYVEKSLSSEVSGNIIDLCPVGALTSKPYAYKARSWELKKTESISVHDAVGSNIRVDARGKEVMRILPRINEKINEEWISDKERFSYDGLKVQRLDRPMIKQELHLKAVTWEKALSVIAEKFRKTDSAKIAAIAGSMADLESMFALKETLSKIGVKHFECREEGIKLDNKSRGGYLFNTTIENIEKADLCLIIGANPRLEATIINTRLRKSYVKNGLKVANIGPEYDLTYNVKQLGNDLTLIEEILTGHHQFAETLKSSKNPMLIIGYDALTRDDSQFVLKKVRDLAIKYNIVREDWNGFNVLHRNASRVGAFEIGFLPENNDDNIETIYKKCQSGEIELLYLLGSDEIDMAKLGNAFVIYQGHHGDKGAHRADIILPGAAYTEKSATYVNIEGRAQRTRHAVSPVGEAKEDWQIIKLITEMLGQDIGFKTISELRKLMADKYHHLTELDKITKSEFTEFGKEGVISKESIDKSVDNYYTTDVICRASKTMSECSVVKNQNIDKQEVA